MGTNIDRERFTASDMKRFTARLHESLAVLRELLDQPGFGRGAPSLGAELETYIADLHPSHRPRRAGSQPLLSPAL